MIHVIAGLCLWLLFSCRKLVKLRYPFKSKRSRSFHRNTFVITWLSDIVNQLFFHSLCWGNQNYIQNHWCITSLRLVFIIHSFISYPYLEYIFRIRWSQLRNRPSFRRFFSRFRTTHHPREFPLFHRIAWFHISLKAQILIDNKDIWKEQKTMVYTTRKMTNLS